MLRDERCIRGTAQCHANYKSNPGYIMFTEFLFERYFQNNLPDLLVTEWGSNIGPCKTQKTLKKMP